MITVTLPGLTLTNDPSRTGATLTALEGWYDSVGPRLDVVEYDHGHGAYDQDPVYDSPRSITVAGHLTVFSSTAVFELQRTVMALKALGGFQVAVTDPLGVLTATVRVGGRIEFDVVDEEGEAVFEIPLFARDPRKYGPEVIASTGLASTAGGLTFPLGSTRIDPFFPSDSLYPSDTLFPSGDI